MLKMGFAEDVEGLLTRSGARPARGTSLRPSRTRLGTAEAPPPAVSRLPPFARSRRSRAPAASRCSSRDAAAVDQRVAAKYMATPSCSTRSARRRSSRGTVRHDAAPRALAGVGDEAEARVRSGEPQGRARAAPAARAALLEDVILAEPRCGAPRARRRAPRGRAAAAAAATGAPIVFTETARVRQLAGGNAFRTLSAQVLHGDIGQGASSRWRRCARDARGAARDALFPTTTTCFRRRRPTTTVTPTTTV